MPINSIILQPAEASLQAAYLPIVITVSATATNTAAVPPVVSCDIYFNDIFYKTISRTQAKEVADLYSVWEFDLQSAAQEYLNTYVGDLSAGTLIEVPGVMAKAEARLRSSGIDPQGFIVHEGVRPVQGTANKKPVSGTGMPSVVFYVVNAILQHSQNNSLEGFLEELKVDPQIWEQGSFPLTSRPARNEIGLHDSDMFGAIVDTDNCLSSLELRYRYKGQTTFRTMAKPISQPCSIVIESITIQQVAGTTNAVISWTANGEATGFIYRLDGGITLTAESSPVTISGISVGSHSIEVAAVCQCSEGVITEKAFNIVNPESFVCPSAITGITALQTGPGSVSINWTFSGSIGSYQYRVDNGAWIPVTSKPFTINGLTAETIISSGDHTVDIRPFCTNGVQGTAGAIEFTVLSLPSITKTVDYVESGLRFQHFEIGEAVSPGNRFVLTVYSISITVTAVSGDTPSTIAQKLADAINDTSPTQWDANGSAPAVGTPGFKPIANASGPTVIVELNTQNSFSYQAFLV